jgi:hypothetical protein
MNHVAGPAGQDLPGLAVVLAVEIDELAPLGGPLVLAPPGLDLLG